MPPNTGVPTLRRANGIGRAGPVPTPGQHTDALLTEVLGYDRAAIDALRQAGAVA